MSSNIAPPALPPFLHPFEPPNRRIGRRRVRAAAVRLMRRWLLTASRNFG